MTRNLNEVSRRITLLTDFGSADGYVAAMRGVIASLAPDAVVDDAGHEIAHGNVEAAAWAIGRYWRLYPEQTVHVVVVDPGVGGARRAVAGECDGRFVVAPDNGVLTHVLDEAAVSRLVAIENDTLLRHPVSRTFHGRDVFAPAAAHLVGGGALNALGPDIGDPVRFAVPRPRRDEQTLRGAVIHVDVFGNLITNIPRDWVEAGEGGLAGDVMLGGASVGSVRRAYSEVETGQALALVGSADLLEIAVRDGSAARSLDAARGAEVVVRLSSS